MVSSNALRAGACAFLLFASTQAAAQATATSLAAAIDAAWQRSPQMRALLSQREEVAAGREAASRWTPGAPSLGLAERNDRLTSRDGIRETEVSLSSPMWRPGQRPARQALAESDNDTLDAQFEHTRLVIAGNVREHLWAVAAAREALDEAQDHRRHLSDLAAEVMRRVEAGDLARTDGMLAQQEVLAAQAGVSTARARLNEALSRYRLLTGQDEIPTLTTEPITAPAADPHPRVMAARAAMQRAQASLRVAQVSRAEAPTLGVSMRRERERDVVGSTHTVGVAVQIPFGTGSRNRVVETAAVTQIDAATAELAQTEMSVQADIELAQQQLHEAARGLDAAAARTALTTEHVQLIEKAFRLGERGLADVIRARSLAHEAEAAEGQQRVALGAAHAKVNQAKGILP